jgi:hypothetical protein
MEGHFVKQKETDAAALRPIKGFCSLQSLQTKHAYTRISGFERDQKKCLFFGYSEGLFLQTAEGPGSSINGLTRHQCAGL